MEVTSTGPQTIQKAQWETVRLGCTYTPGPQDTGELDIEWSNLSPDMTQKDKLVGRRRCQNVPLVNACSTDPTNQAYLQSEGKRRSL